MAWLAGYAVRWGDLAEVDGHLERFDRGAFRHAISTRLCLAHGRPIAYCVAVVEDSEGLRFQTKLDDAEHRSLIAAIRDGGDGVSIRYAASRTRWQGSVEVIEAARLKEISVAIGDPAYPGSRCWIEDEHEPPRAGSGPARGVEQVEAVAKPVAAPVRMQPAGPGISAAFSLARPAAPIDPLRTMLCRHMAAYLARGLAS